MYIWNGEKEKWSKVKRLYMYTCTYFRLIFLQVGPEKILMILRVELHHHFAFSPFFCAMWLPNEKSYMSNKKQDEKITQCFWKTFFQRKCFGFIFRRVVISLHNLWQKRVNHHHHQFFYRQPTNQPLTLTVVLIITIYFQRQEKSTKLEEILLIRSNDPIV